MVKGRFPLVTILLEYVKCICLHFCSQEAGVQLFGIGVVEMLSTVYMTSNRPLECA